MPPLGEAFSVPRRENWHLSLAAFGEMVSRPAGAASGVLSEPAAGGVSGLGVF